METSAQIIFLIVVTATIVFGSVIIHYALTTPGPQYVEMFFGSGLAAAGVIGLISELSDLFSG